MKEELVEKLLLSMAESLSVLAIQHAIIAELISRKLPSLSEVEKRTLARSTDNNYSIAKEFRDAVLRLKKT